LQVELEAAHEARLLAEREAQEQADALERARAVAHKARAEVRPPPIPYPPLHTVFVSQPKM